MTALDELLAIPEAAIRPVLNPEIWVEPKDKDPADEDSRQWAFIAFIRKYARQCRAVGIPNAGRRSPWEAMKRKREGMTAGEPDVCVTWADHPSARIEFKNGRKMPDDDQIDALNWYFERGHPVAVCRTPAGCLKWLRSIGAPVGEIWG